MLMRSINTLWVCADHAWADALQVATVSGMMGCRKFIIAEATASFSLCATVQTNDLLVNYLAKWRANRVHWQKTAGCDPYWASPDSFKSQAQ